MIIDINQPATTSDSPFSLLAWYVGSKIIGV
jgi:hypothetical protein